MDIVKVKRIMAFIVVCAILVTSALSGISVIAAEPLTVSSSTYVEGEEVLVTATGSGKDWVGIYSKGEIPGSGLDSIYWYYVEDYTGAVSITETVYNSTRAQYKDLPAGEYTLYLLENDGYNIISSVDITVTVASAADEELPLAPLSLTYNRTATENGLADGEVTVTLNGEGPAAKDIVLFWADENGVALEDYRELQLQPVSAGQTTVSFNLVANTIVPKVAKKLIAYAKNEHGISVECASVALPAEAVDYDFGTPLAEFQVVSDVHIIINGTSYNKDNNKHFVQMLEDIKNVSPLSAGVFIVGDVTETGSQAEYDEVNRLYGSVENAPQMYWGIGNHDFDLAGGNANTYIERFLTNYNQYLSENVDKVYYDMWIDDIHCIFLGSESNQNTALNGNRGDVNAYISDAQLAWLEETLAEGYEKGKPIFVFMHQAIYNTVAGSLSGQGWDGINTHGKVDGNESELMSLLASYPEALYFSGHSHWELNSINTMFNGNNSMCNAFNTASVGYLWTSYGNTHSGGTEYTYPLLDTDDTGSQGYYVQVYEDKVLVLGRDFANSLWMPSAMFCVDYAALADDTTDVPTESPTETPTTEAPATEAPATESAEATEVPATDATEAPAEEPTNVPADDSENNNPLTGDSLIILLAIAVACVACVVFAVVFVRKKRADK